MSAINGSSVEIDVSKFIPVLEKFQNNGDFVDCFVMDNNVHFVHLGQFDLIEYTINAINAINSIQQLQEETNNKPTSFEIKISDWLSALRLCNRATISIPDLTLIAHCSWGKIKVFNRKITQTSHTSHTTIDSASDKFSIPLEAFKSVVNHLKPSKLIYLQALNNFLIFTDDDQKNVISIPVDLPFNIPEVAYDYNLISNCNCNCLTSMSLCVLMSFAKDAPLHVEFEYFFQNKLRFVIAPIIED